MCKQNATATWSGFAHQGQVGLLVALRKMREVGEAEYPNYFLEYEEKEDVAIYRNPGNPEYISVHQVKAYYGQGKYKNKYKKALADFIGCGNDYLHTVVDIVDWDDADTPNPKEIIRYEYTNGKMHCGTNEIEGFIIQELMHFAVGGVSPQLLLDRLTYELDAKIRDEHTKIHKPLFDVKFSFTEIIEILNKGNLVGDENDIYRCRKHFYQVFKNYVEKNTITQEHLDLISENIIDVIYRLPDTEFDRFVKQLNLALHPSSLKVGCAISFNEDGFLDVFYHVLFNVTHSAALLRNESIQYNLPNSSEIHVLTTVTRSNNLNDIVRNIIQNANELNLLWEGHQLINMHHDVKFINHFGNLKINAIRDEIESPINFFSKRGGLISRDKAKAILNHE
jgi:hypothetical protein